jgi:hypothetical protein
MQCTNACGVAPRWVSEYFTYRVEVIAHYVNGAVWNQEITSLARSLHVVKLKNSFNGVLL